eukprot:COSAG06_NODE_1640_length_8833_cov_21.039386_8_plen_79_part_00
MERIDPEPAAAPEAGVTGGGDAGAAEQIAQARHDMAELETLRRCCSTDMAELEIIETIAELQQHIEQLEAGPEPVWVK